MRGLSCLVTSLALVLVPLELQASPWTLAPVSADELHAASGADASEPDLEAARAEYRKGSDAYALANYEVAIGHFERAYQLSQEPELLFDLGQAYTRWYDLSNDLEHLEKARRMFENYVINLDLTGLDEEAKAQARADAQRRIAEVDRLIAQHQQAKPDGDDDRRRSDKPVHKRAWFWVTIVGGLAVIGGVAAGVVLATRRPDEFTPELGTIGRAPAGPGLTLRF